MSRLRNYFISHPLLAVAYLLLLCLSFRIVDIFILKLDERIGEIIISKSIGFILIILFLLLIGKRIKDIYLHRANLKIGISLAFIQVLLALSFCYGIKYLFVALQGGEPYFALNDEYTILTVILFVFIGNIINTLMEEGLFRGVMITTFTRMISFWKANTIQALLFGLWHIPWTIKDYLNGKIDFQALIINGAQYTLISAIMGFIMGYMFHKTKTLWTTIVWHTIWNSTLNLLLIKSLVFADDSDVMNNGFVLFWLGFIGYSLASLLITKIFINKVKIKNDSLSVS